MIVVVNPSDGLGFSFKGLHQYCAADENRTTAERVAWTDTRNLAVDDPEQGYKIMIATARAQNELLKANGVRRSSSKKGHVMHVVMSPDKDEPQDEESMKAAADELLSKLGADPARMRGKSKPKVRQFADEHQVTMYAHDEGEDKPTHVHLMVNVVHPETGRRLPDSNINSKAQAWALKYSKTHGTAHKTPAREENAEFRKLYDPKSKQGYVRGKKRMSRQEYEARQKLEKQQADEAQIEEFMAQQRKKDAALAQKGRNLAALQARELALLVKAHQERKAGIDLHLRRELTRIQNEVREALRGDWSQMRAQHKLDRKSFEAMEETFFGRIGNSLREIVPPSRQKDDENQSVLRRGFQILANAGARKEAQKQRHKSATEAMLERHAAMVKERADVARKAHEEKMRAARKTYLEERRNTLASHEQAREALKAHWKKRTAEKKAALLSLKTVKPEFTKVAARPQAQTQRDERQVKPAVNDNPPPKSITESKPPASNVDLRSAFDDIDRAGAKSERNQDRERD